MLSLFQMMRNIFLKCFNTYKAESEPRLCDAFAIKHMTFTPRLFEVKLSQRVETTTYFKVSDMFVAAEGETARCYNIHTGTFYMIHTGRFYDNPREKKCWYYLCSVGVTFCTKVGITIYVQVNDFVNLTKFSIYILHTYGSTN